MSLWDDLERKHRRVVVVPVQISDPSTTMRQMQEVAAAVGLARENGELDTVTSLNARLVELQADYERHFTKVRLQSLPAPQWEAATTLYQDEAGRMDWSMALAPLLAESCVDPDLKDAERWEKMLAGDSWSDGDVKAFQAALLHLNVTAMDALIPKD